MKEKVDPYYQRFLDVTEQPKLNALATELSSDVADLGGRGLIKADERAVDRWRERVESLRTDLSAINLHVLRYERLTDPLDMANRSLVRKTLKGVRDHVDAVRTPRGLKRVLAQFLEPDDSYRDDDDWNMLYAKICTLVDKARAELGRG